ncbi:Pycsar system effector family protein [Micromonospora azadirachtae]|uniref:Pycsar system effector family protein n=1 Tax=Micromonospora azadirachtae TaxID=1970735 RepID=A0ABW2ZVL3_9ACTN
MTVVPRAERPPAAGGIPLDALLQETRQEVGRTDAKAGLLLALLGVLMGLFVSLAVTSTTRPLNGWAVGITTAFFLASALLLVWAVRPRLGVGGRGQQEYFAHFARFADRTDDLARELACAPDDVDARRAAQLVDLSCLVLRKYRLIQVAVDLLLTAVAIGGVAVLLALWRS